MNRALIVLVLFSVLIGGQNLSEKYTPSAQELYYQDIMLQLEGKQTDEKTSLILTEQTRYQDAFSQIEKIDEMISNGTIDENVGDTMKSQWYSVTAFYPAFQRVVQQYDLVCKMMKIIFMIQVICIYLALWGMILFLIYFYYPLDSFLLSAM